MLDNCCHGVGLGVCVAAEELRVAACSSDFALPLGFADKHSALGSGLIAHLRSRAVPFAAALALALAHTLTSASVASSVTSSVTSAFTSTLAPAPPPPALASATPTTAALTTRCPGTMRRRRQSTVYAWPRASGAHTAACSWCARR